MTVIILSVALVCLEQQGDAADGLQRCWDQANSIMVRFHFAFSALMRQGLSLGLTFLELLTSWRLHIAGAIWLWIVPTRLSF